MVCIKTHLFQVVMFPADTQTFLAIGHTSPFGRFVAENNILKLVHTRIGEHQCGIIFYHHRGRRNDLMPFAFEKLLERLTNLLGR